MRIDHLARRGFLQGALASLAASSMPRMAAAQEVCHDKAACAQNLCKPKPDFTFVNVKALAGIRPWREDTYLLKAEEIAGKHIVHNYGHGGAGITMSWGCAAGVASEVETILKGDGQLATSGIAVLGAGVMGLTAATTLAIKYPGIKIDIYAEKFYRETTSHVAGGQFAPSSVEWDETSAQARKAFKDVITASYHQFSKMMGTKYGVSEKDNYTLYDHGGLKAAREAGLIEHHSLTRLPFADMNCSGHVYKTLLIEPPIFLKQVHNELYAKLGPAAFHPKTVFSPPGDGQVLSPDIAKLKQKIIVNCTGLGAGALFKDPRVKPIKGHLLLLQPQKLDYMFSGYDCHDWVQYMFPRSDGVVIGGTYQKGKDDPSTNEEVGKYMVRRMKALFDGTLPKCDATVDTATKVEHDHPTPKPKPA